MLWGAALYNNGAIPWKNPRFRRELRRRWHRRQRLQTIPQADPRGHAPSRRAGIPRSAAALRGDPARQHPARLRARRRSALARAASARSTAPTLCFPGAAAHASPRSPSSPSLGTNDHPGGLSVERIAPRATSSTPMTATGSISGPLRYVGQHRPDRKPRDATIPARRARPPDPPRLHALDPVEPVRRVATSIPGTSFANAYLGYTWWDNETHGEYLYPRTAQHPTPEQESCRALTSKPRRRARCADSGPTCIPGEANHLGEVRRPRLPRSHGRGEPALGTGPSSPTSMAMAGSSAPSSSMTRKGRLPRRGRRRSGRPRDAGEHAGGDRDAGPTAGRMAAPASPST